MVKKRILIVEDNPIVAEDIKTSLLDLGYEVTATVHSSKDAIKSAEIEIPDIALMDIQLGKGMNGIDTAAELRRKYQVPVIYLTAYADENTIDRAKITEPFGYIIKPFDDKELQSAIEIALYKHQMERKLRVSEEWLKTALTSIGDGVIATDMEGCVTFINPVAESLTGWTINEALGRPLSVVFNIINEFSREPCENPVAKVIQTGQVVGLANHTLLISRDGREMPIKDSGSPIVLNGKDKLGVILVFQDNTENREAEAALRESEERYRAMMEQAADGVFLHNKTGRILDANRKVCRSLGYSREELLSMSIADIDPDAIRAEKHKVWDAVISGDNLTFESHHRRKDGTNFPVEITLSSVGLKTGPAIVGIARDITERKKSQEEHDRLMSAIEQVGDMVIITGIDGVIQYVNPAFVKITGYSKQEAVGQNPRFLKSGLHDRGFYKNFWNTILSGKQWTGRIVNKRKDGTLYTGECSISPVRNQDGTVDNFVWISRDITEQLELEQRSQQNQKLESIGALAGGIAHDFNNILSSVIGFTELALDEVEKNTTIEDSLQEVYAAGTRAKDLVGQILAFARQSDEKRKPIQVSSIVKEVLKFIRSSIPTTIKIRQNIESDSLIMGNATRVHQVMMNLCTNAAHAMEEMGGVLEITLKDVAIDGVANTKISELKPGDYIEVQVSDTGVGIPPDILGSIFEPYFTTKGPGEGTGMGLAMVNGIVETYGGEITVDSRLGAGTTFTVYLPITRKRQEHRPYEPGDLPTGTERVLFVDDEASIAKMGSQVLERLGYQVTTRTSSVEALELFRSKPNDFDLIVTDMTMPNMTGDKLAIELMKIRQDIPVILCTGYSKKLSDENAAEFGIKAFAYKPIVKSHLAKTVRKVLDEAKSGAHA